ncbi:unnamed protein product, partial [Rotaria socialis]
DAPIPSPTNPIPILGLELVGIDSNWNWNWNWFRIGLKQLDFPRYNQYITFFYFNLHSNFPVKIMFLKTETRTFGGRHRRWRDIWGRSQLIIYIASLIAF